MIAKIILGLLLLSSTCVDQNATTTPVAATDVQQELRSELAALSPFLGTWTIDTKLNDGQPVRARRHYEAGLDGNFVIVDAFNENADGKERQMYHAVWQWDQEAEKIMSHRFQNDGTYTKSEITLDTDDQGRPSVASISARAGSPVAVQQTTKLIDETSCSWTVTASVVKNNPIAKGIWKKQ